MDYKMGCKKLFAWAWALVKRWWIFILLCVFVAIYILKYLYPNTNTNENKNDALNFIKFLVDSLVAAAIILYVVYTRDLAKSSQITADANLKIVQSMQSLLLEKWECFFVGSATMIPQGESVSSEIYLEDKKMKEKDYHEYLKKDKKRILVFKPRNCGSKLVLLKSMKFQINDTRSNKTRDISYTPPTFIAIQQDKEAEILAAYNIEGEMEIRVSEISYLDGDLLQNKWIASGYRESERYQEPESSLAE